MSPRPFSRRKKNEVKNQEALDFFRKFNRLAPSTRAKYQVSIEEFMEFLLVHKKSLWDADYLDILKFIVTDDTKYARSVLSTFYRVLIDAGEFKRENPVIQLVKYERETGERVVVEAPKDRAESVIQQLGDEQKVKPKRTRTTTSKQIIGRKIVTLSDLEILLQRTQHIRDRAILEFLYATGVRIHEIINLTMSDVDLEARQVTLRGGDDEFRVLLLPRRTGGFLKIYERWRRRQLSPSAYYFITKGKAKKKMSDASISNWLRRIQKDKDPTDRWTATDFRKRALLQHYWITRDITAVARFGGYKRPESALNIISNILNEQGVESIDMLGELPEFQQLQSNKQKLASVSGDNQLSVTVELRPEDMEYIRNTGLTPTQAIRSIISFRGVYGESGGSPSPTPSIKDGSAEITVGTPSVGLPNAGLPQASTGAPVISTPTAGGPNLGATAPSGGPNLDVSGPSLDSPGPSLSKAPDLDVLKPVDKPASRPPPMKAPEKPAEPDQMTELQVLLARRRKMSQEPEEVVTGDEGGTTPLGAIIKDVEPSGPSKTNDDDKKDEEEEIPELPDFDL